MISEAINKKHKEFISSYTHNNKIFITKLTEIIQSNSNTIAKAILYELTRQTVHKEFQLDNYLYIIENIYQTGGGFVNFILATLIDTLWLVGFILEKHNESEQEYISQYSALVNSLIKKKIISQNSLLEKLEETSLLDCGIIQDKKAFKTRLTRLNTKITYEQQKYNLLREESEGFSKLIFLLFEVKIIKDKVGEYIDKILCLIGFFDLDPNRVLDIILSAFENDCYNENFLELVKLFNPNALPQILGFKFSIRSEIEDIGLYIVTAQLIKFNLLLIIDILPHLSPSLSEIEKSFKSRIEYAQEFYTKSLHQRVSKELSMASLQVTANPSLTDNLTRTANYFVNFNEILNECYNNKQILANKEIQIYRLFEALVKVKDIDHCEIIYSLLEDFYDPLICPPLVKTLSETIDWIIQPIYAKHSLNRFFNNSKNKLQRQANYNLNSNNSSEDYSNNCNSLQQVHSLKDFLISIKNHIKYLTVGLSNDQILFSKILIIIRQNSKFFIDDSLNELTTANNIKIITDLICKVFLPSISLIDPTPSLVNELWNVISIFDYSKRYKIYHYWINNIYSTHPALYLKYGVVLKEADKWQKTLSKENQRAHGRTLGILTNANPIIVFDNIIRLITIYDNQINVFMQTLSLCSSLSYDVITYVISKSLADPSREKLNITNGDMASWFKYFAYFIGHFFKKYHMAEFSGIMLYLGGKLKNYSSYVEMYVLKEMIEKMTGVVVMEELNDSQIHSCAGGMYLYLESMDLIKEYKNLKKPTQALLKFFISNPRVRDDSNTQSQILIPENDFVDINTVNGNHLNTLLASYNSQLTFTSILLILLSIRRQNIIFNSNYTQSKLIGYLYDQMQNIFLQLIQFLSMHTDRETYSKLLPKWNLSQLVINYNCTPETIFFISRNKLKPLYEMEQNEYDDYINQFQNVMDSYQSINKKIFLKGFDSMYIDGSNFIEDINKEIWKYITPELFFIFSAFQLRDIYLPLANYEKEIEKNKKEIERLIEEGKIFSDSQSGKNKKELEKIKNNIENLEKELTTLKKHNEKIIQFLEEKKTSLLDDNSIPKGNRREISRFLIQYCLYPRLIFSKVEAVYAAKMLVLLIDLKIQNINVFDVMQKMIKFLLPCVLCLTEFEAQNLGVFLLEFLKEVRIWQDESIWKNQCVTNPAFSRNLETATPVDLMDFKKVIICLLSKMNSTFLTIFSGDDYMSCRNAIIVLNSINSVYPPIKEIANELTNSIDKAVEKFVNYEDLTMMMKRYRDILLFKKNSLPYENEITGEKEREKDKSSSKGRNGEKKKKKERSKEREKRREDNSRTPDLKKRNNEEDYKQNKNRNK